jgi:hypothetical protein
VRGEKSTLQQISQLNWHVGLNKLMFMLDQEIFMMKPDGMTYRLDMLDFTFIMNIALLIEIRPP